MLRINRTLPLYIPLTSKLFKPIRHNHFFGKLNGPHVPPDPFFFGDKISFQPMKNLELGFSRALISKKKILPGNFRTFRSNLSVKDKSVPSLAEALGRIEVNVCPVFCDSFICSKMNAKTLGE
jgi:Capsule assembly protein Wzi